jgi:2-polyprenyl-3-methyl-5-hydroxy-6-metoxy-1,4-benzoquinol methylase
MEAGMVAQTGIRAWFSARAPHYDTLLTRIIGETEMRAIAALIPRGSQVLDYGCGTGRATLALVARNCTVTAYDLSPEMLEIARQKAARAGASVEFVVDEAALAGRQWPVVACIGVLDYYRDPAPLLRTLAGYLAPGGIIVTTFPNATSPLAWAYAAGSRFTFPAIPRTVASFRTAARDAGLHISRIRPVFPPIPYLALTIVALLVPAPRHE